MKSQTVSDDMSEPSIKQLSHHVQQPLCTTRERYRQGRKLTAIKVYTVNDESRHLLVHGVPSIAIHDELETLCKKFGELEKFTKLPDYPREEFTDVYQVTFRRLPTSRFAKRQLDNKNYYGGILHVCYAPELESLEDTRAKLIDRRKAVELRTSDGSNPRAKSHNDPSQRNRQLKRNAHQNLQQPRAKRLAIHDGTGYNYESTSVSQEAGLVSQDKSKPLVESSVSSSVPDQNPSTSSTTSSSIRLVPRQISVKRIVFKQPEDSCPSLTSNKPDFSEKKSS